MEFPLPTGIARPRLARRLALLALPGLVVGSCGEGGGVEGGPGGEGFVDASFNFPKTALDGPVHVIAPAAGVSGDVYVGGGFTSYGGTGSNRIVALDADGTIDAGFVVGTGFDGDVHAIATATDASGDVYVGGGFIFYDGRASRRIIRLDADGSVDTGFDVGTGFNGNVFAIAPAADASGDVYVGGSFGRYDGIDSRRIIRLDADGSVDTGFDVGTGFNGDVLAIAPATDGSGDIYVGGTFLTYNGTRSNFIVALNADGTIDSGFDIGTGFIDEVHAIAVATDGSGDLYVGGAFTGYDGTAASHIIRLDANGSVDAAFDVGAGFDNDVFAIAPATDGSGDVYVGGQFLAYDGTRSSFIIALDADGTVDAGFDVGAGFDSRVLAVAPASDASGDVYVGGTFSLYDGTGSKSLIGLNADGTIDAGFGVPGRAGFNNDVLAIAPATDASGDVYVGGAFTSYDGTAVNRIVRLDADGTIDAGFDVGTGFNATVTVITPATDGSGDIYVGGGFTSYDGTAVNRIVRLDADGAVDAGFDVGTGFDDLVWTIAPTTGASGDVYVGGFFFSYDGTLSTSIIRLDADGTVDAGFDAGAGFDSGVLAIAPAADGSGDVYVGGHFDFYDGTRSSRLIRLTADGTVDVGFDVGTGFSNLVWTIAPVTGASGGVYVGGVFASYNGAASRRIIRLTADGTADAGFDVGTGFDSSVVAIAPAADASGDVYVGGSFTDYDGTGSSYIIRLDADGTADAGFDVGAGFNGDVRAIAPATDASGDVYVGGLFDFYDGTQVDRAAALDPDGQVD